MRLIPPPRTQVDEIDLRIDHLRARREQVAEGSAATVLDEYAELTLRFRRYLAELRFELEHGQ